MNLLYQLLDIRPGVTAFVGGGGKTSAIFRIAEELAREGAGGLICTTTHMLRPEGYPVLLGENIEKIRQAMATSGWAVAAARQEGAKLAGIGEAVLEAFASGYVLVEGDGAKRMPAKVPAAHEPVIPERAGHVVAVMGASALGKPFGAVCFRGELWQADPEAPLSPRLAAELLASRQGGKKDVGNRHFTILINQADANPALAMETKRELERRGEHCVVASARGEGEIC